MVPIPRLLYPYVSMCTNLYIVYKMYDFYQYAYDTIIQICQFTLSFGIKFNFVTNLYTNMYQYVPIYTLCIKCMIFTNMHMTPLSRYVSLL